MRVPASDVIITRLAPAATDEAQRAHDVPRPPRLRGTTRDRRLWPLSGAMAWEAARLHADP